MEPTGGIEPPTYSLPWSCSAAELRGPIFKVVVKLILKELASGATFQELLSSECVSLVKIRLTVDEPPFGRFASRMLRSDSLIMFSQSSMNVGCEADVPRTIVCILKEIDRVHVSSVA